MLGEGLLTTNEDREFQVGITKSDDKREWKQKVEKVFHCVYDGGDGQG